jgi:hypothetical protein
MGPYGDKVAMAAVLIGGTFTGQVQGFASVGLIGAIFTLTLAPGYFLDPVDSLPIASIQGSGVSPAVTLVSDSVIEVRTFGADGAASARAFHIVVARRAVG